MKPFISRSIAFSVPVLLLCAGAEMLARKIPNDYSLKRDYITQNRDDIEVLYLGNSHAFYGINPECAEQPSFNLAYVSQSLDCDLPLIEKYFSEASGLKVIALSIGYSTLLARLDTSEESWRAKNYFLYYGINTPGRSLANRFEILSNNPMGLLKRIKRVHLRHKMPQLCTPLGQGIAPAAAPGDLEETARSAAARHTKPNFQALEDNIRILNTIFRFARERNILVLLYTPPVSKPYIELLNPDQLALMQNTCTAAADIHDHVFYLDYMNSPAFGPSDFFDADHLNQTGAEKFTRMISTEIGRILEGLPAE